MNKSMLIGLGIGVVVAVTGGAIAGFGLSNSNEPAYAEVVNVTEVTKTVQVPREVCEDMAVTRQKPVTDDKQIVGTVAGAVIGGVLGNQVGGGSGKKIATVAGAAAGGYAGNKTQEHLQANNTYSDVEQRCRQVNEPQVKVLGYDVSYRLGDEIGKLRMDHRPGDTILVANGKLVLTE